MAGALQGRDSNCVVLGIAGSAPPGHTAPGSAKGSRNSGQAGGAGGAKGGGQGQGVGVGGLLWAVRSCSQPRPYLCQVLASSPSPALLRLCCNTPTDPPRASRPRSRSRSRSRSCQIPRLV